MIAYLLANWKQLASAALIAGAAGYALHRPEQPAVTAKVDDKATQETRTEEGPWTVKTWDFAPDVRRRGQPEGGARHVPYIPTPGPVTSSVAPAVPNTGQLLRYREEQHGASTSETHSAQEHKLDLTITPQAKAGWALEVGAEDLLGGRQVRVGLRRRLFGPIWAGVGAVPARREIGASVSMEW